MKAGKSGQLPVGCQWNWFTMKPAVLKPEPCKGKGSWKPALAARTWSDALRKVAPACNASRSDAGGGSNPVAPTILGTVFPSVSSVPDFAVVTGW